MAKSPIIKKIQLTMYRVPMKDLTTDLAFAAGMFYEPGSVIYRDMLRVRIHTDAGVTGEHVSGTPGTLEPIRMFTPFLIGKNALERELFYNQAKVILRKNDRMGIGPIDVALWDLAGKYHNAPVYRLLGGYRQKLPAYASTYHADRAPDGLSSPEGYADFAEQCLEMGYPGFKIHSWGAAPIEREIETVHAVGKRVGGKMALMLDPCCVYDTYGDALQVGLACDEEGYYWYEDPLKDGGVSFSAYRRLRQALNPAPPGRARTPGGGPYGHGQRRGHRLLEGRSRLRRRHHRRHEDRPRGGRSRHGLGVARRRPSATPLHGRDTQLQVLRDDTGASQSSYRQVRSHSQRIR